MMEEMDARTFAEWAAFDSVEPLDPAGALLDGLAQRKPQEPQRPRPAQTWQEQYAVMRELSASLRGRAPVPRPPKPKNPYPIE